MKLALHFEKNGTTLEIATVSNNQNDSMYTKFFK
jgi:hypothetical protein